MRIASSAAASVDLARVEHRRACRRRPGTCRTGRRSPRSPCRSPRSATTASRWRSRRTPRRPRWAGGTSGRPWPSPRPWRLAAEADGGRAAPCRAATGGLEGLDVLLGDRPLLLAALEVGARWPGPPRRPAPMARITVAPPVTMSPPAKTPGRLVAWVGVVGHDVAPLVEAEAGRGLGDDRVGLGAERVDDRVALELLELAGRRRACGAPSRRARRAPSPRPSCRARCRPRR